MRSLYVSIAHIMKPVIRLIVFPDLTAPSHMMPTQCWNRGIFHQYMDKSCFGLNTHSMPRFSVLSGFADIFAIASSFRFRDVCNP